jgi:hypothetical protein
MSGPAPAPPPWDYESALQHDCRVERLILIKEILVIAAIIALVILRVTFVR